MQIFLRYKGGLGIAMEPRIGKIREKNHGSGPRVCFLKLPFILYLSLVRSCPFHVLLRQARIAVVYATDFK